MRCNATDGYCHEASVYLGKEDSTAGANGLYFTIVDDLTKRIRWKNFRVFFDNLYTGIPLLKFLYSKKIYSVGTARSGRKLLPNGIRNCGRLSRGEFKTFQDSDLSNLTCTVWKDTKEVRFASTMSNPELVTHAVRRVQHTHTNVSMPHCAHQYTKHYSGVDRFDTLRSKKYGCLSRPSKKTWKHLLWFLVNCSLVNSWIIYQKSATGQRKKNYAHSNFRLDVAKGLIGGFTCRQRNSNRRCNVTPTTPENAATHQLVNMGVKRPKRCYGHKRFKPNGKDRKETVRGCKICNIHLCPDCFLLWHSPGGVQVNT